MRILVTGGTGVMGAGTLPELLRRGHSVRLLARGAKSEAAAYPERVEPFPASVTDPDRLNGAAQDCDGVIHIAGIVEERPPARTFQSVNVEGTQYVVNEARRAGVRRFLYISSLGADVGTSPYHKSKRAAEQIVENSGLAWTILRPGTVYGPGDEVISLLLKLVRGLPVIPVVGFDDQPFQPLWFEDMGKAAAVAIGRGDCVERILEIAGDEITTTRELIGKLGAITERSPLAMPVPATLTRVASRLVERFESLEKLLERSGLVMPINSNKLQMLLEENVIHEPDRNALPNLLRVMPTSLDAGLRLLADELPELLPEEGVGSMERKTFRADIEGSRLNAGELLVEVRAHIEDLMPIEFRAQPGASEKVEQGDTYTASIPARGQAPVRAVEANEHSLTFATLQGHPLAGLVTFRTEDLDGAVVRFSIELHARAANIFDWVAMRTIGRPMQSANWRTVVTRVVELSGGVAPDGLEEKSEPVSEEIAEAVSRHAKALARETARQEHSENIPSDNTSSRNEQGWR